MFLTSKVSIKAEILHQYCGSNTTQGKLNEFADYTKTLLFDSAQLRWRGARDGVEVSDCDRKALLVKTVYKSKMSTRVGQPLNRRYNIVSYADEDRGEDLFLTRRSDSKQSQKLESHGNGNIHEATIRWFRYNQRKLMESYPRTKNSKKVWWFDSMKYPPRINLTSNHFQSNKLV